ncbi:hypothetical protein CEXT_42791 [Caerostris extrusa]|uniref:Uncharacterized protein n=1 Tax=Caerostris extrusa TaxID=172846 RepID=A0AAV4TT55_CAEEX|nr:hypothetical protein CEXT_42791 [Caerostris extrusa]
MSRCEHHSFPSILDKHKRIAQLNDKAVAKDWPLIEIQKIYNYASRYTYASHASNRECRDANVGGVVAGASSLPTSPRAVFRPAMVPSDLH